MAKDKKVIDPISDGSFEEVVESIALTPKQATAINTPNEAISGNQSDFLFYSTADGTDRIKVYLADEDVWINQQALAKIFGLDKSGISRHLKNIFEINELDRNSVVAKIATTGTDGKTYRVDHYNLDAILAVGYRANTRKASQFRRWASTVLREYLVKGFAMDDERLKQGKTLFGKDYFDELLERIREIRASERRFYQKITDIYALSYDYDSEAETSRLFFKHAQNKLEYAVTGMTAAEIIKKRADHNLPNMGLTTWKNQKNGGKVRKGDVTTAKNYLTEGEISDLNRLVSMFLDFAENMAKKGKLMSMDDWSSKLDEFLKFNEFEILQNFGKMKKINADSHAEREFSIFKPMQDENFKSDFDTIVEQIKPKA